MLNVQKYFFIFLKELIFDKKKYCWDLLGNINQPIWENEFKYKIDFGKCTENLIAIDYE